MKKLYLFFLALGALGSDAFAKSVDVATAQKAGYNFMAAKVPEGVTKAEDLQLVYTNRSQASATSCFYVFNAGSGGFVIVSADDQVKPVLGYSTESIFEPNNIPAHAGWWLQQYADQIAYVITNNLKADGEVTGAWTYLLAGQSTGAQNKTTIAGPLLTTKWNQNPYYNSLCPKSGSQSTVTGCVATTMAQLMNYWSYPTKGIGSSSYNHASFGTLSANYAATTYAWANMPSQLSATSTAAELQAVGTLMLHAGIAVEMNYGVSGSAAQSLEYYSGAPSAEHALKTYFGYTGAAGLKRSDFSTAQWKSKLTKELDEGRPVYYAGTDPSAGAGHAWVCDGYDATQNFHMNWGWGGMYNGYFSVDNLAPGTGGTGGGTGNYTSNQRAIVGIQAPGAIVPDNYESNNASATAKVVPAPGMSNNKGVANLDANFHNASDEDYYEVDMPANGSRYKVTARVHDSKSSANGKTYSVDAKFAANTSKLSLNSYNDVTLANPMTVNGGSSAFFKVIPVTAGAKGTYLLEVTITDIATGVAEVSSVNDVRIYPNPAADILHIDLAGLIADRVVLTDVTGRIVVNMDIKGKSTVDMNVSNMARGTYFVAIQAGVVSIGKQVTISK
ncbi:MAG: T9SS type A sorting domain-containing protein [Sphingobacteriales bacterium]|nr:MAG: T9SS type A sorting domain-containing protein [Sphingobacteriales bacterium]